MRDLVKAGLSLTWAMPLLGAQQLATWLSPGGGRRAACGFDEVSRATADGLARDRGPAGRLYQLGECAREGLINLAPTLLTPELLYPSTWVEAASEMGRRALAASRLLTEGKGGLVLEELRSKGEVFCLVLDVSRLIGVPSEPPFPLAELLVRACSLGPFRALWAVEGLGHDYGDSFWEQGIAPQGILSAERTGGLPEASLTMLNAGIGLSFAQRCLRGARACTPPAELAATVARIVRLGRDNARPGYLGAAWESLGLVTRTFHPDLVAAVDRALRAVAPEALGYYWHGVGRALFFAPINFLPGSDAFIFETALREAPDEPARLNAVAGAAWAYALVTQRNPEILASLVLGPHGEALERAGGFANGIASSMMMRFDTTPGAPFIEPFLRYRPASPRLVALWDRLVRAPGETALEAYYPVIKAHGRLGDIFEYHDLPELVGRLREAA
jgi:hypothetical protein